MNRGKAYEYESLEELSNSSMAGLIAGLGERHHRPLHTSYSGSALNRLLTEDEDFLSRKYPGRRSHSSIRRSSDGGMTMTDYLTDPSLLAGTAHQYGASQSGRLRYGSDPRSLTMTRGLSYDLDRSSSGSHLTQHYGGLHGGTTTKSILSRKPRSWHPSPYGSDEEFIEEDDILTREAKKQRIKAEIARRRQQIEQNSRLHDELLRLARLREGDVGYQGNHGLTSASNLGAYGNVNSRTGAGTNASSSSSVLRSINDILREDRSDFGGAHHHHPHHRSRSSSSGSHMMYDQYNLSPARHQRHGGGGYGSHSRGASPARPNMVNAYGIPTEEERSMERLASTFRTEDYTASLYERLHDFSPLTSDQEPHHHHHHHHQQQQHHHHHPSYHHHQHPHGGVGGNVAAMPLLPDMPSRSRKLLEDLASEAPTMHIQSRGKYGGVVQQQPPPQQRYLSPR